MNKNDPGLPSRSSSMRPPSDPAFRFSLMTPSASPPVQRTFVRQSDGPSPTKKRRVSCTPSLRGPGARNYSVVSASSSSMSPAFTLVTAVDPGEDLHVARRASSFRVLNVWSQLADKYSRRLDEDDIVDLEKETIVKDYGILRSSSDAFEIGCFADEHERAERLDNGQPLTPVDDELDELDAFADTRDNISRPEMDGDEDDGLELVRQSKRLPPVREVDPADAADLAEFLKAEQSRKEMFGDPDDDEGDQYEEEEDESAEEGHMQDIETQEGEGEGEIFDADSAVSRSDTEGDLTERDVLSSGAEGIVYRESVHDDDDDVGNNNEAYRRFSTPSDSPESDILNMSYNEDYWRTSTPSGSPEFDILNISYDENYRRTSTPSGSPEFDILNISYMEMDSDTEEANISTESVDNDVQVVAEDSLAVASDENSEDEIGGWQHDEGSTLYSVGDFSEGSADEGEYESSKEHTPPPTSDPPPLSRNGKAQGMRQKLESSYRPPATRVRPKTPSRKNASTSSKSSPTPVVQLQAPPCLKIGRPKSAIRETPSRGRSRWQRRVSFSSPEATHIEDHAYDFGSDNVIEVESSDAEDSDVESCRLRRETHSMRSLQLQSQPRRHARAQTPAPPGPSSTLEFSEDRPRSMHSDSRTRKRDAMGREDARTPGSISEASYNVNRKRYR